jgi:hypothetical protein
VDRFGFGASACRDAADASSTNHLAGHSSGDWRWAGDHFAIWWITRRYCTGRQRHACAWRRTGAHDGQRNSSNWRGDGSALRGVELVHAWITT